MFIIRNKHKKNIYHCVSFRFEHQDYAEVNGYNDNTVKTWQQEEEKKEKNMFFSIEIIRILTG